MTFGNYFMRYICGFGGQNKVETICRHDLTDVRWQSPSVDKNIRKISVGGWCAEWRKERLKAGESGGYSPVTEARV